MTTTNTSRPASGTDQRACVTCGEPTVPTGAFKFRHDNWDLDRNHPAQPKLAHPMDADPFAGIDENTEWEATQPAVGDAPTSTDTRTCWMPGDQEHDHAMCEDAVLDAAMAAIPTGDRSEVVALMDKFPPSEPEPSISLAAFQQRVAAGEWNAPIIANGEMNPDAVTAAVPAQKVNGEYFVAPGGYGDPTLWRASSDPNAPEEIVTRPALDSLHEDLWPAVVTHFTSINRGH